MYRQILVHELQTPWQTIFWRSDINEDIMEYKLKTLTYGTTSASFLAIRVMHELTNIEASNFPLGLSTVINDFYVNDLLTGANSRKEAIEIHNQTIKLLQKRGFQLRKRSSNYPDLLKDMLHKSNNVPVHFINCNQEIRTLGIQWNTRDNTLQYTINIPDSQKVTKRTMLSMLSKVFDPLDLLGPVTLLAKIIIQKLWQLNLN